MRPYNLAAPRRNPFCRMNGHPRTCPECGIVRPYKLAGRKAPRQAARVIIKAELTS